MVYIYRSDVHLVESTVSCMGVVLNKSCVKSNQTFHEILSILCLMLDHRTPPSGSQISNCKYIHTYIYTHTYIHTYIHT